MAPRTLALDEDIAVWPDTIRSVEHGGAHPIAKDSKGLGRDYRAIWGNAGQAGGLAALAMRR
jgi:hypothetical protein